MINFGRAFRIETNINDRNKRHKHGRSASYQVIKTITGQNSSVYGKETSQKIGAFLRAQVGDYTKKTGFIISNISGTPYLFTGEDAVRAREILAQSKEDIKGIEKWRKTPITKDTPSREKHLRKDIHYARYLQISRNLKKDCALLDLTEDGLTSRGKRQYSSLSIEFDEDYRAKKITYHTSGNKKEGLNPSTKTLEV